MPIDPEPAETTLSKVTRYVEFAIVAVLALAALGGIIRFIYLADVF